MENALKTLGSWATGIPWEIESQPRQMPQPPAFGIWVGPDQLTNAGRDYYKVEPVTGRASVHAWRTCVVSAKIVTYSQAGNKRAQWLMQQLIMALALPDVSPALAAAGLAVARIGAARSFDTTGVTKRVESIAVCDLTLNWVPSALSPATDYGVIRSVSGTMLLDGSSSAWQVGP
jgi:hypothetical protein